MQPSSPLLEPLLEMKVLPKCGRGRSSHLITLALKMDNRSSCHAALQSWLVYAFISFVALTFHIPQQKF